MQDAETIPELTNSRALATHTNRLADTSRDIQVAMWHTLKLVRGPMSLEEVAAACDLRVTHTKSHLRALIADGLVFRCGEKFKAAVR